MPLRRNILVFHSGGLGDFVLSWPLGLALGRLHPQSRIIYITQHSKGELASRVMGLEWLDAESGWSALYNDGGKLDDRFLRTLQGAQFIYSFLATPGDDWCRRVREIAPETEIVCLRTPPPDDYPGHVSEHLLAQLTEHSAVRPAVEQILTSISKQGLGWRRPVNGAILVHPGSGGRDKNIRLDIFGRVIEELVRNARSVRVLLGEVELERFSDSEIQHLEAKSTVVKPARYVDLFNEIVQSAAFIGNDSGPAHLAGIYGVPTAALFRTTLARRWKPLGPRVAAIEVSEDCEDENLEDRADVIVKGMQQVETLPEPARVIRGAVATDES